MKLARTIILAAIICAVAIMCAVQFSAQSPTAAGALKSADTIQLPAARTTQLKQIQDRQNALQREYEALEAQKIILAQRAALELHLTAEQIDTMELSAVGDSYYFKPKPVPSPTPK